MSYLRPFSNPEGLYVIGIGKGTSVEFLGATIDGETVDVHLPRHVFHGLLQRWYRSSGTEAKYRGAKLTETTDFRWALSYSTWPGRIVMYQSTLMYICTQNADYIGLEL